MTKDDFWAAIAILGGVADDASTSRLVDYLADRGEPAIVAFAETLARAVFDLDTPTHGAQSVYDSSEDADGPAIPMSSDVFLHARLAVVASGRDAYERVLADPTAMSGVWPLAEAESLLDVAGRAYEAATGLLWDHQTTVSMETGSNAAAWGSSAEPEHGKWWTWLMVGSGWDVGTSDRQRYLAAMHLLERALDADPAWQEWWSHASAPDLELNPFYSNDSLDPARVRRGRKVVRCEYSFDAREIAAAAGEALPGLAASNLRTMLELVRDKLRLPPLPNVPDIGSLDHVPDAAPQHLPDTPAEMLDELLAMLGDGRSLPVPPTQQSEAYGLIHKLVADLEADD